MEEVEREGVERQDDRHTRTQVVGKNGKGVGIGGKIQRGWRGVRSSTTD